MSDVGLVRAINKTMTDTGLLERFTREHAQDAFTELVKRHVGLVYTAARRQVHSHHGAQEVSQDVFLELARHAHRIAPGQPLGPWLYVVTRRTAIDYLRRESRRLVRESTAAELATMKTAPESWSRVESMIDEAMAALNEGERAALVLRYFENRPLRDVGAALGIAEDTAQKRVSRALGRLRNLLSRRGFAVTGSALATQLSSNAVQAAPTGAASAIAAHVTATPIAFATASHTLMTTLQKAGVAAVVMLGMGLALYEGAGVLRLRRGVRAAEADVAVLSRDARSLEREIEALRRETASAGYSSAGSELDAVLTREAAAWVTRIDHLKQVLANHPSWNIPEMQLLTDRDWLLASLQDSDTSSVGAVRSLRFLRTRAKGAFLEKLRAAMTAAAGSTRTIPTQLDDIKARLATVVDPSAFDRYEFHSDGNLLVFSENPAAAPDDEYFGLFMFGRDSRGLHSTVSQETISERAVREAAQAYARAHGGTRATEPSQLQPYLSRPLTPEEAGAAFRRLQEPFR